MAEQMSEMLKAITKEMLN